MNAPLNIDFNRQDNELQEGIYVRTAPYYAGGFGTAEGIRLQSRRSSLHVPLALFLQVAAEAIRQAGGIAISPEEVAVLKGMLELKEKAGAR